MGEEAKYEVLEKIGHGSFGIIRKVRRKNDGHILCRKEISYIKMSTKEREQLQAELAILKELRHPNIVAYYEREHLKASQDLHLYMEYCGNGDLGRVIKTLKLKNQYAEEEFVWSIFSQLVTALYRCHYGEDAPEVGRNVMGLGNDAKPIKSKQEKYMILHRDLKPENVFLGADNSVKLGDFGLSKIMSSHDFASTYVGTPFYMSPEICAAERYTLYSDIWSLGCIIYELCAREPPFNAKTHWDLVQKIKAGRVNPLPSCYSGELQKVISSCLQVNPNVRPDTAQLLNLPIVKLMRKEQEVVRLGQQLKAEKELVSKSLREAQERVARMDAEKETRREEVRAELEASIRREWEVRAQLAIDRQVQLQIEQLRKAFESEVNKRVEEELARRRSLTSESSMTRQPRSSTPTLQVELPKLNTDDVHFEPIGATSTSTLGSSSEFASTTDLSSLSLESPVENVQPLDLEPKKRRTRTPFARAKTYTAAATSPVDIQMVDPSPVSHSVASLSLSPRRTQPRKNIFAAANSGSRWEPILPPSPSDLPSDDEDLEGSLDGFDFDEDIPTLPSPTRARSAASNYSNNVDPFKAPTRIGAKSGIQNRHPSAPNLFTSGNNVRVRPQSAVPIIATSPTARRKTKPIIAKQTSSTGAGTQSDAVSPSRKQATSPSKEPSNNNNNNSGGFKSKKGNEAMRTQVMRNQHQIQGRTLVELAQARSAPPAQNMPSTEEHQQQDAALVNKTTSGMVAPNRDLAFAAKVAEWDPEKDEMPSPFLVKTRKLIL